MSQVRKTTFITLAFMFSAGLLSGCGISGPLYARVMIWAKNRNRQW